MLAAILTVGALFAATPAADPAHPAAPSSNVSPVVVNGQSPQALATRKANTLECENVAVLGSLLPKEMCATHEAIAQRRQADQDTIRRGQALRPYKVEGNFIDQR